jgi:hypothetical protein
MVAMHCPVFWFVNLDLNYYYKLSLFFC